MYQCKSSSKCIAQIRLFDNKDDCDYGDDELWISPDYNCPIKSPQMYVNCTMNNTCISRKVLNDRSCHCRTVDDYDLCDHKAEQLDLTGYQISFPIICDNHTELQPILINGQYETDETNCEQWVCNNIYTRCNGAWNCFNGEDELDCYPPAIMNCPVHSYVCLSTTTYDFMCLSATKLNDGNIDCLGAIDESQFCRYNKSAYSRNLFYWNNKGDSSCTSSMELCNGISICSQFEDEKFCYFLFTINLFDPSGNCETENILHCSDAEKYFCKLFAPTKYLTIEHFSLSAIKLSDKSISKRDIKKKSNSSLINRDSFEREDLCHRSPIIRIWLNKEESLSTTSCLCPTGYYGDRCQFQSERVSLTLRLRTFSDSWRTPFTVVVSLIDNSDERIIHSSEQFTYLPMFNCKTKFNIDLLYWTRRKNQSMQYSVHIDVYEKVSLAYRGSLLLSLPFPFLPVQRIATLLNIPPLGHNFKNCSLHQGIHGQCIQYFDHPNYSTFCRCESGWSGRNCNISNHCTCSSDLLCLGTMANNRSICVCLIHKWGSRCLLHGQICQSNPYSIRYS